MDSDQKNTRHTIYHRWNLMEGGREEKESKRYKCPKSDLFRKPPLSQATSGTSELGEAKRGNSQTLTEVRSTERATMQSTHSHVSKDP